MQKACGGSDSLNNYTRMPNVVLDTLMAELGVTDTAILQVIIRLTIGWQKTSEAISYTVFMNRTRIKSRSTISAAIKRLEKRGFIKVTRINNHTSKYEFCCKEFAEPNEIKSSRDLSQPITLEKNENTGSDKGLVYQENTYTGNTVDNSLDGLESLIKCPSIGLIQKKEKESKETSSSSLSDYLKKLDSKLIFDHQFYDNAVSYLSRNDLDIEYCSWLYHQIVSQGTIKNITGYFFTVFFKENQRELFLSQNAIVEKAQVAIRCPVCDDVSTSSIRCTHCNRSLLDLSQEEIHRLRSLNGLSDSERAMYDSQYLEILDTHAFGIMRQKEIERLNARFGIQYKES